MCYGRRLGLPSEIKYWEKIHTKSFLWSPIEYMHGRRVLTPSFWANCIRSTNIIGNTTVFNLYNIKHQILHSNFFSNLSVSSMQRRKGDQLLGFHGKKDPTPGFHGRRVQNYHHFINLLHCHGIKKRWSCAVVWVLYPSTEAHI